MTTPTRQPDIMATALRCMYACLALLVLMMGMASMCHADDPILDITGGYYRVLDDQGVEVSQHTTLRKALQTLVNESLANDGREYLLVMDPIRGSASAPVIPPIDEPQAEPDPVEPALIPAEAHVPAEGDTLAQAFRDLKANDKRVIALPAGRWELGDTKWLKQNGPGEGETVTVRGAPGVERNDIILYGSGSTTWRPYSTVIYEGVSIDWTGIEKVYGHAGGFRDCRWFSADRDLYPVNHPVEGSYWIEDSRIHDMKFGPTRADRVERCTIERISGDVFFDARIVRDTTVNDVDGSRLEYHSDVHQISGSDSTIRGGYVWERNKYTNIKRTQIFMLQSFIPSDMPAVWPDWDARATIDGLTIRNITVEYIDDPDDPQRSMLGGFWRNVEIDNLNMPGQRINAETHHGRGGFENVVFRNCTLNPESELNVEGVEVIE